MRVLSKINPELIEILDWWKEWISSLDIESNVIEKAKPKNIDKDNDKI